MKILNLFFFLLIGAKLFAQPLNDNPCNAIPLPVGNTCTQTDANNFGATASAGVPAPSCGTPAYSGGDVWFSAVCPASGSFTVMMTFAGLDNIALAMYQGGCTSLSLVSCDYDGIGVGNMPEINGTGLTPGATYYFRVWNPPNNTTGAISICAIATATAVQAPTNQDCLNAIPVCQSTFTNSTAFVGTGNIGLEINSGPSCLGSGEKNDVWYQFSVQNSGQFCFAIDPITNTNDYDWALYNMTGANCSDIYSNSALEVACNFSGSTTWFNGGAVPSWVLSGNENGTTGMFPSSATGNTESMNQPCIAVTAGQDFVLNISAFSTTPAGFYLNFPPPGTTGMAVIYDNIPPALQTPQAFPACGGNQLFVTFNENIQCSTVSSADFSLTGPGGPYSISNQIGSACSGGGTYENSFVLGFTPALTTSGVYTVCLNAAAASSVLDACGNAAASGCFTFAITAPSITAVPANLNCNGVPTGSIVATGAGSASFTYQLNTNTAQASGTYTGLAAGTYTVKAIALSGCPATTVVTITQPPALTVTPSSAPTCSTVSSGSVSSLVSGGTAGYTYSWSPTGGTGSTATGLAAGTYTLKVTDSKGCVLTNTTTVAVNPKPSATLSFTNPTCGNNNGVIVINNTSSGGQTISTFTSNLGSVSGQTVTGLGASTPVITLTNNFGCTFTVSATLTMTPGPTNVSVTPTNATCGNNNGSITFGSPTGGTAPYTYSVNNVSATSPSSGLAPGTYSVTVRDVNGCVFTRTTSIINIPGPTAIAGTTTQASCNTNNGTFNVTGVTGGTPAYTYSVDGVSTGSLTSGLAAGTHSVTVKDVNGCVFTRTFVIITANGPSSFSVTTTNASCGSSNGTSTVTSVVGGTPTYSYSFDGGGFATTSNTTSLSAGTHTVVVKDANSCTITATYIVGSNPPPTVSVTSSLNILCNGASTGSLAVTPSGGTAPYTYTLTSPSQTNTTGSFTGLPAGTYSVTVRDNAGCTATVTATLTQPTPVTGTITSLPVNCFGNATGTVSAGGAGGVAPYTYLWPALGNSTLATVGGAAAGTYTVTIRDANLCPITQTVTVTQPTSLTLTSTLTPATCGDANGSGTVTVSGGTTPYTYNWSNSGLTNVLSGASAGTYTLTVTDFNGCVLTRTVAITNIPGPTAITGTTTLAGCNLSNGTYNVTGVTGGTPAYSYSVDAVATSSLTTGLSAGTHTITVRDLNGCLFSTTFVINTANGPTSANIVTANASCGSANGSATVTSVTGGLAPYQYSFNGGAFGVGTTASGMVAGTYSVTIRDANSCTLTVTYNVLNNSGPTASVTNSINVNCFGGSTGSFTVTPSGGTSPYTYSLTSPAQTNGTGVFTGLPAGSYNITIGDNLGCTTTASVTLTQPPVVTLTVTSLPVGCFGASTGTVSASGGGGVGPYTYSWPALSASTATVNNVAAGTYSVTQTDFNGCSITQSVTVTQPTSLTLTSTLTPATCGNANGSGTVTVAGGTPAYTYSWSSGAISSVLSGASAATYTLNVTDFNGCVLTRTLTITNIPGPTAITGTTTLAGCGLSNGTYNVTGVTGGTAAYSYSVDAVATSSLTGGLAAGTHTVTVSDLNGCLFSTTFNIGTTTGPATATVTSSNASCGSANGTSTVTGVTGGTAPYQYSFDGGATFVTGASTTGLTAGTHTVTIKDANSCTLTVTYNVLNNGSPTASIPSTTNTSCFGGSNGGFTIVGAAGSGAPYTYTLTAPFQSNGTGIFTGLITGTYTVITKDNAGCTVTTTVAISEPTQVALTPTSIPAKCFGASTGTINIAGSGGTSPYQYSLNGAPYQASSSYTAVGANIYNVAIQDFNGCVATQTVEVTQPTALAIQVATQNANCTAANGVATTTVTGGTPIYTYTWTGGGGASATSNSVVAGTYSVTATDVNGCSITGQAVIGTTPGGAATITALSNVTCNGANDGSLTASMIGGSAPFTYSWTPSGQTVATAVNLAPTTYTCEITDTYGCKAYISGTVTQPSTLTAIMNSNNVKCYGTATGTISAAGTGGTAPYTYLWASIPSTLSTVANVAIGTYTCDITDANGCTISPTISVTQPTSITLTSTVTSANCNQANGSATVIASGGAPGAYIYTWSNGANTPSQGSLLAGTYTIQVQDANNCIEVVSATIPNTAGPVISVTSQTNVSCFGGTNGVATTSVSGGVAPYIYSWSNGNVSSIAPNLSAQVYTVSATDIAGCVSSTSVSITEPTQLTVSIIPNDPKCFGAANGYGIGAALGGTPNYTYTWSGLGGNSATSNPIVAGNYALTVVDGNGCVASASMALVNPPAMAASITSTNVSCFAACNGVATGSSVNGVGVVDYFWVGGSSPISSQTATGLCAGTYTMIATDQNTCTASAIITITEPPILTASISSTGSVTCNGGNNGFAVVSPGGGSPAYTYVWSGAAASNGNSSNANNLPAGNYTVTVSDTHSCSVIATTTILEPAPLATTLTTTNVKCNGACDGTANIAFSGGAGTTTFLWQPGLQSGNSVNNLCAGNQTVTITSNGSCPTVLTFTLTEPALLTAATTATNSNCGQSNGKTCAVVGGGTSPLTYLWSNAVNTLCNNNVISGAYSFTVTDANGCIATASGLVNDVAGPVVTVTSQTNVSCFNGNNGAATTNITGGVPSYSVSWSSGQTTQNVSNFNAGTHNITVVDQAGCIGTASVTITEPTQLVSAIGSFSNVTCNGLSNGEATMLVNGGTTPYSYSWTPSGQTSSILVSVPSNTYTGVVTDGNGCVTSSSVVIAQPQALVMSASSFTNISCFGGSNGQIATTVQGGTPGYTYSWNPAQSGNSGVLGSLPAGGYSLTVVDSKTCSITANFTILEPSALTSTYTSLPAKCGVANGSATVTVGGGTPSYTLNWNTAPAQQGTVATNMAPGSNWQCVITDLNGCSITQTISVADAPSPIFSSPVITKPTCFGLSNGDVTLNYSSGTAPYTVVWSSPISQTITTSALTQSVAGIAQGAYTATLTDSYGCATSQQINVTQPGLLVLIVSPDPTICYGQSTQLNASGQSGSPAYSYTWNPNPFAGGGPHTVNPTVTTTYTVAVSDVNGCSPAPKVITVNVTPQLTVTGHSVEICHGTAGILIPTMTSAGNGGPYTYAWNPTAANTNSTMVVGNAPTVQTTNTVALTVSDGCTIPNATTVFTVVTNPLPTVTFTANTVEACAPALICFTATPGTAGNYTYDWISNNKDLMGTGNPLCYNYIFADSLDVTVNITNDVTGCVNSLTKTDYIVIHKQPIASFFATPQTTTILDPEIDFTNTSQDAAGYYWDFGDPTAPTGFNNSMVTNPSHYYNNAGVYNVYLIATSSYGCKDTAQVVLEITPDFALYIPNAFTPDGNDKNDMFQPMGVGINEDDYRMDIFDRWGENVFTSNNFRKGWDGSIKGSSKPAPQGVYIYKLMVTDLQGNKHPYVGHVTVIRQNNNNN